jgi:hypothetical protein
MIELVISGRSRDLGGFTVRRVLPYATHRMVGPFIFFDHIGPATLAPGAAMDVRPHPHVNLATVTYLFAGRVGHRDSLGTDRVIEPGAVNWMTAGRGIVHSERTPEPERSGASALHGVQLWVALPTESEEGPPTFSHHPRSTLPEFVVEGAPVRLLLGEMFGKSSPVPISSPLVYADIRLDAEASIRMPGRDFEHAAYVVSGEVVIDGRTVVENEMAIWPRGEDVVITSANGAHVMLIGGAPVGPRFIFWNFVSSSKDRVEEAKRDWAGGPSADNPRFKPIPGDDREFIPLPNEPGQPKGTIL